MSESTSERTPQQVPDTAFSEKAVELGYATPEQIGECREVLQRMSSMGVQETLSAVLVKKGVLTQHQVTAVLRALGVQVQPIPGYVILDRVGKGGYGEVYRARQVSMDRLVALKILSPKATQSPEFVERFFKEAQAAAKLNHRAIIQAYDAGCANGLYYFAMEFVPGETAREIVKRDGPFAEKRALELAAEALDALAYIHRHKLIHRDIKPENFLIAQDGRLKICDFGLAKSQEVEEKGAREGYTLGTPYYMSPEQIAGERILDIRSDLYSLGATLFYLLTGRHVFEAKEMRSVMRQHLVAPPPAPGSIVPGLSRGTDQIVLKLLEKDRRRRYQTPEEAAEDVRRVLQGGAPAHATAVRRRTLWMLGGAGAGAAAAAILLILAVFLLAGPSKPPSPPTDPAPAPDPMAVLTPAPIENPTASPQLPPQPPLQVPAVDDREVRAEGAYTRAEIRFRELSDRAGRSEDAAEEWIRLEAEYRAIERDHAATQFFRERKRELWERAEACQQGARRAEDRARAGAEAELAAARKGFEEACSLMGAAAWTEAAVRFRALMAGRIPTEITYRDLERLASECELEIQAGEAWGRLRELQGRAAWKELEEAISKYSERFGGTRTATGRGAELDGLRKRAAAERAGAAAWRELKTAFDGGRWAEAVQRIEAFAREHRETDAFRAHEGELSEMSRTAAAKLREPLEKSAKEVWASAQAEIQKKAYARARELLERLRAEPLAATEFAKQIQPEIEARKATVEAAIAEEANEQAKEMLATARRLLREDRPEDAFPLLDRLLKDETLAATSTVQRQRRMIERDAQRAEKEFEDLKANLIDGFDGDLKGWEARADGKKGSIHPSEEAYSGKGAARIAFEAHDGKWSYLDRQCRPAPEGALGISFYAKAVNPRVVRIRIQFRQGQGESEAVYRAERDVGASWTNVRIPWSEFRLVMSNNKQRPPAFDPSKIRSVEFSQGTIDWAGTYLVDRLKFETR